MSKLEVSQRSRSLSNPLDLGVFDRISIRHFTGRLGAENKGQAPFRLSNSGAQNASQNVWFQFKLNQPSYVTLIKDPSLDRTFTRWYNLALCTNDGPERKSIGHPIYYDKNNKFYRGMVGATQSDLYNVIDEQSSYRDQNRTTLLPLSKGTYKLNVNTQRWDMIRYDMYMIVETPSKTGYCVLEDYSNTDNSYLALESNSFMLPSFFLYESSNNDNISPVREYEVHDPRRWKEAWKEVYPNQSFPDTLSNYLKLVNSD